MFGLFKRSSEDKKRKQVEYALKLATLLLDGKAKVNEDGVLYMSVLVNQGFTSSEACFSMLSMALHKK